MNDWYSLPGFFQPMSSIGHLSGAICFLVLSFFLLIPVWRERLKFWCLGIFAFSTVTLLSLSGVYHMFPTNTTVRSVMLRLDVAAIFLLIAGSFTPIHGILFKGWKRWGFLIPIWTIAITGITLRSIFGEAVPNWVGIIIFLAMGWLGAFSAYLVWTHYGTRLAKPIVLGGVIYSLGAVGELFDWPVIIPLVWGPHETFHFAVLGGLAFHWHANALVAENRIHHVSQVEPLGELDPSASLIS